MRALGAALVCALTVVLASAAFAQNKKHKDPNEKKKSNELKSVYKFPDIRRSNLPRVP